MYRNEVVCDVQWCDVMSSHEHQGLTSAVPLYGGVMRELLPNMASSSLAGMTMTSSSAHTHQRKEVKTTQEHCHHHLHHYLHHYPAFQHNPGMNIYLSISLCFSLFLVKYISVHVSFHFSLHFHILIFFITNSHCVTLQGNLGNLVHHYCASYRESHKSPFTVQIKLRKPHLMT